MKTIFSTLLILFSFLATNSLGASFIPEKEFVDDYGNKVIVQDGDLSWANMSSDISTWVMTQEGEIKFPCLVTYQKEKSQGKIVHLIEGTDDLQNVNLSPGNWLIKVFTLTPQGEQGRKLATFSLAVRSGRTILVRFYLK